jgi:hypothetical protein
MLSGTGKLVKKGCFTSIRVSGQGHGEFFFGHVHVHTQIIIA